MYVARNFNLKVEDLKKDTKERRVINARYIAIYFCKVLLGMSYSEIARLFGKPDHTHALYAVRKVEEKKSKDKKFFMMLEAMQSSLKKILQ
jgi:chromosomal replication initiator protein